jgi:hypothetical protein
VSQQFPKVTLFFENKRMFDNYEDDDNSDGTVTDTEDTEIEIVEEEVVVVVPEKERKRKKPSNSKFLQSYTKELLNMVIHFDRFVGEEEQLSYVKAFVEKYPPVKPKKTTTVKRNKAAYDYFREDKLRNEFKGMSIAESSPLIASQWKDVKSDVERRKVWDDMVEGAGGNVKKTAAKDPYGLFADEARHVILQHQPHLSKDDVNKECRKRWRGLEDREKGVWYAKKAKICEA